MVIELVKILVYAQASDSFTVFVHAIQGLTHHCNVGSLHHTGNPGRIPFGHRSHPCRTQDLACKDLAAAGDDTAGMKCHLLASGPGRQIGRTAEEARRAPVDICCLLGSGPGFPPWEGCSRRSLPRSPGIPPLGGCSLRSFRSLAWLKLYHSFG